MIGEIPGYQPDTVKKNSLRRRVVATIGGIGIVATLAGCGPREATATPTPKPQSVLLETIIFNPELFDNQELCTSGYEQSHPGPYGPERPLTPAASSRADRKYFKTDLRTAPDPDAPALDTRSVREVRTIQPVVPEEKDTYNEVEVCGTIIETAGRREEFGRYYILEAKSITKLRENVPAQK